MFPTLALLWQPVTKYLDEFHNGLPCTPPKRQGSDKHWNVSNFKSLKYMKVSNLSLMKELKFLKIQKWKDGEVAVEL